MVVQNRMITLGRQRRSARDLTVVDRVFSPVRCAEAKPLTPAKKLRRSGLVNRPLPSARFVAIGRAGDLIGRRGIRSPVESEADGREKKVESGKETAAERALVFLVSSRLSPLYCSIFGRDAAKNHRSRFSSPLINPDNILAISSRLSLSEMCSSGVSNRLR